MIDLKWNDYLIAKDIATIPREWYSHKYKTHRNTNKITKLLNKEITNIPLLKSDQYTISIMKLKSVLVQSNNV